MVETTLGSLESSGVLALGDGYRTKRTELAQDGYRIIRVADVKDGVISLTSPDFVSEDYVRQIGAKVATSGDVLLTTKGTIGRVAIVPDAISPAVYSPQLCWFRIKNSEVLNRRYLSYWLQSTGFLTQASHMQGNTDMAPYISLVDLRSSKVTLPPVSEQQAIAEVLGVLDDKIAANVELISLADQLTAAAYRASLGGGEPTSLGAAAQFQNRRRVPLSASERESRPGSVRYFGANGPIGTVNTPIFNEPLVLMGEDGSVVHEDGTPFVHYVWGPLWVNNHAHVLLGDGISTELLSVILRDVDVSALVTGAVQPKLSMGQALRIEFMLPEASKLNLLENLVSTLFAAVRLSSEENRTLAATRDALLPQLMSGKLRVHDAEAAASAAGA